MTVTHGFGVTGGARSVEHNLGVVGIHWHDIGQWKCIAVHDVLKTKHVVRQIIVATTAHHMAEVGQSWPQFANHPHEIKSAKPVRDEQDFGFGIAQNESQFLASVYRHDGVDHEPADRCGNRQWHCLGNIGELKGERGSRFDAQLLNASGELVSLMPRLCIGQSNARVEQQRRIIRARGCALLSQRCQRGVPERCVSDEIHLCPSLMLAVGIVIRGGCAHLCAPHLPPSSLRHRSPSRWFLLAVDDYIVWALFKTNQPACLSALEHAVRGY